MAKHDEISSTEKLLELIRDEKEPEIAGADAGMSSPRPSGSRFKGLSSIPVSFKKSITVGVDLGHEDLKMVRINRLSEHKFEMLDYARIPFDNDFPKNSPQFFQFLKSALDNFCGKAKNIEIWSTISSARVETRQIRIPKVAQKQIPNSVYWSYQRISPFTEKEKIFDFETLGEIDVDGNKKIDVMAYTAPRQEVQDLRELFAKAGYPLSGISIVPFAFQALLRSQRIKTDESAVSSLYIGRDWSRIDIFRDGNLMLSRGIKAGIKTMIEALQTEIEQNWFELSLAKSPTKDSTRIRAIKKRLKQEMALAHQLFFGVIYGDGPEKMDQRQLAITEERIFRMILPALERLVRQVERTIRHFSLNFDNARVGQIYISSGVRPHPRLLEYIGEELGIPAEPVNPFASGSNFLALVPQPEIESEQSSYAPAMGMALSDNSRTPNFLHTYKEKKNSKASQLVNRGIFGLFIILILLCVGVSFWQEGQIQERSYRKSQLQQQLSDFELRVDQNLILRLVEQIRSKNKMIGSLSKDYYGIALINEVSTLTPANIRLVNLATKLGGLQTEKIEPDKKKKKGLPDQKNVLILDGIIRGDRLSLESDLAGYLMQLKNSPLFDQPTIRKKSFEFFDGKQIMRFTAQLDLVS